MKVLLVNPDYEIERYMGRHFGRMGWVMPPMGLLYLAAKLEQEGIEAEDSLEIDDWMQLSSMGGYREEELYYVPEGRDSEELKKLQRRANIGFYFRPLTMAGFARRTRSFGELREYASGAWGLLRATVAPY